MRLMMIGYEMRTTIGATGRCFELWKRMTIYIASVLLTQRVIRGFIARRRRIFVSKLRRKALQIQAGTRQLIMKLKYRKKYYKFYWAAVTIQRHFRGRMSRRRVTSIVEAYYDVEKKKLEAARAAWIIERKQKAATAIQMTVRKFLRRRRTMKKMIEKNRIDKARIEMERVVEEAKLAKSVHRLKLTNWYIARKVEYDKDRLDETQTSLQRKAIFDRRNAARKADQRKRAEVREAQLERLEEEKIELWLKAWEVKIEQRGIERRKKCQAIIELPENQSEVLMKKVLQKRINTQMKEVLRKADKMKIPMEIPEAKEIATRDIIEEEVQQELAAARAEMKAESLAIQRAEEEKIEAKRKQDKADVKRKRKWAIIVIQSYARVYLARKEVRRRAYKRYERHFDPSTHNYFYADKKTGQTFWKKPPSLGSYDVPMADSWVVMHDSEGDQYFYNVLTWKQSWDPPMGCVLCEVCSDDFAVAKLSEDRVSYCNRCLYNRAQELLANDIDATQILFKPFAGNEVRKRGCLCHSFHSFSLFFFSLSLFFTLFLSFFLNFYASSLQQSWSTSGKFQRSRGSCNL